MEFKGFSDPLSTLKLTYNVPPLNAFLYKKGNVWKLETPDQWHRKYYFLPLEIFLSSSFIAFQKADIN